MRRSLWGLSAFLLGCGGAFAQTPPATQSPRTLPPFPTSPLPSQSASTGNPLAPLTPVAPAPLPTTFGSTNLPSSQPVLVEVKDTTAAALTENLTSFENMRVDLSWANNRWQLKAGDVVLKDFGRRELEARQALRLMRDLRLTQRGTLGSPNPVMEYWLSNGRAPQGLTSGMRTVSLDASSLHVEQDQGQWVLRDTRRVLFNFGQNETDAKQAMAVMQKYHFTQLVIVGQAAPEMIVFLAQPVDRFSAQQAPRGPNINHQTNQPHDPAHNPAQVPHDNLSKLTGGNNTLVTPAVPPLRQPSLDAQGPHYPFAGAPAQSLIPAHHTFLSPEQTIPGMGDLNNKVPFDWRQVELRQEGPEWKLKVFEHQLANFGGDEQSAKRAFSAIHYYHFNEQCLIGGPDACFSYYLINGKAPMGHLLGAKGQPFQAEALAVKQVGQGWAVVANDQPLVLLRDKPEEAKRLIDEIRRNRFDHLYRLGPDDEHGMTFFVKTR